MRKPLCKNDESVAKKTNQQAWTTAEAGRKGGKVRSPRKIKGSEVMRAVALARWNRVRAEREAAATKNKPRPKPTT